MSTTLLQLRDRTRQRSDNEYSDGEFVVDEELNGLINVSHKHLFALLVESGLHTVEETIYDLVSDGSLTYALPDDCYAVAGVFRPESGEYLPLGRHSQRVFPSDRVEQRAVTYRNHGALESAVIELNPRTSTDTYKVRYVGVPADFTADTDTIEGVVGWEEWIVYDVAIKILTKEGIWDAVDRLQAQQDRLSYKIEAQASERDLHHSAVVKNVGRSSDSLIDENGFLPGGNRGIRGYWGPF
jgi:hypothetical protein